MYVLRFGGMGSLLQNHTIISGLCVTSIDRRSGTNYPQCVQT